MAWYFHFFSTSFPYPCWVFSFSSKSSKTPVLVDINATILGLYSPYELVMGFTGQDNDSSQNWLIRQEKCQQFATNEKLMGAQKETLWGGIKNKLK